MLNTTLTVYVHNYCPGCDYIDEVVTQMAQNYPQVDVQIVDLDDPQADVPDGVFATPTYMLDERVVSLGNPSLEQVSAWFE